MIEVELNEWEAFTASPFVEVFVKGEDSTTVTLEVHEISEEIGFVRPKPRGGWRLISHPGKGHVVRSVEKVLYKAPTPTRIEKIRVAEKGVCRVYNVFFCEDGITRYAEIRHMKQGAIPA